MSCDKTEAGQRAVPLALALVLAGSGSFPVFPRSPTVQRHGLKFQGCRCSVHFPGLPKTNGRYKGHAGHLRGMQRYLGSRKGIIKEH